MANHVRKQVRTAIVTAVTGLATTGSNVFAFRRHRLRESQLPAVLVYFEDERVSNVGERAGSSRLLQRIGRYAIQGVVADSSGVEDTLDDISAEVEAAIGADPKLGGAVRSIMLENAQQAVGDLGIGGDVPVGAVNMRFAVRSLTYEDDPETSQ